MWVVPGTEGATRTEFTWTRTERIAFRLAMVWAVLAGLRLVPLFAFVVPGVAQEVVRAWLEPVGSSVFRYLQYVGASAIGSIQGDFGWGAPIVARYATDAATAVLCQLIGTAIIASTLVA